MKITHELLNAGFAFHGHRCPAMPLGLRAGLKAMEVLGVERSKDKELFVIAETGKGHAMGCFVDGVMTATGCTYGKSNIEKKYWDKMALTLVDTVGGKAVRVALKPEFQAKALASEFVEQRKRGVPPQDVPAEVLQPLLENVLTMPEEGFLTIGAVENRPWTKKAGCFDTVACSVCGDLVFDKSIREKDGQPVCIPCAGC
jgi:formylmethanofuran dehydrogenase subunit E